MPPPLSRPVRILSFDGGGVRGLSSLLILRDLMGRLSMKDGIADTVIRPSEYFDLVIGTGTGGISALFVGRMNMTADQAIDAYLSVAETAFEPKVPIQLWNQQPSLDGGALQREIEMLVLKVLGDYSAKLAVPPNDPATCRTAVLAATADYVDAPPYIFRSYPNGGPSSREAIAEVARATISTSSTFQPVSLGNPPMTFVDAGISGFNNPVEVALDEARKIWPDRDRWVVSLGTGRQGIIAVGRGWNEVAEACRSIIQSCELVHNRILQSRLPKYFRFNVDRGLDDDVREWKDRHESITAITEAYMRWEEVKSVLDQCASVLSRETLGIAHDQRTKHRLDQEDLSILRWLSPLNFGASQKDIFQRRQEGTGKWFLDSSTFKDWCDGIVKTLWCSGMPGSGKTVLTSMVVHHLRTTLCNEKVATACIYCSYNEQAEQTAANLVGSLLKQIVQASNIIPDNIRSLYLENEVDDTHPILEDLIAALKSAISFFSKVYIIVDALDECSEKNGTRSTLLRVLRSLSGMTGLFFTSRELPPSVGGFEGTKTVKVLANNQDVQSYLTGRIAWASKEHLHILQGRIIQKVCQKANGMFLLAKLHMDSLERTHTHAQVWSTLDNLPKEVNATYDEAMKRIEQQHREDKDLAQEVLSWITNAHRPLSVTELQHALAVHPNMTQIDPGYITAEEILLSVCAGLVVVDKECNIVRLVHHTTLQYFEHKQDVLFQNAHKNIAKTCLTYLSSRAFARGHCHTDSEFESLLKDNPFLDYAAHYWGSHAHSSQSAGICKMAQQLLYTSSNIPLISQVMLVEPGVAGYSQRFPHNFSGMHITAFFGMEITMEYELRNGPISNLKDGYGRTPLLWAARNGHERVVQLLVAQDDVVADSRDEQGRTALSFAAFNGHENVVRLLVGRDDVAADSRNMGGRTPLCFAAYSGHESIVRLLMARDDVVVDSRDQQGLTPLSWAAYKGHESVVRLLVARDDVAADSRDKKGRTPLCLAAFNGHESVVQLLVARDDVAADSGDVEGQRPLSWAAFNGHESVVRLLIGRNDVAADSREENGRTPLSWAAFNGHTSVARLLVAREDVVADSRDVDGQTPLSWAAFNGHENVVRLLIARDDVVADSRDVDGQTPLSWAAFNGHESVVRLLLAQKDIAAESRDETGRTPLSWAAFNGHESIVRLFVARDDVAASSRDETGQTPLSLAAYKGHESIVQLLVTRDDVTAYSRDENGRTPLSWAAYSGHESIVRLLVAQRDVAASPVDKDGRTPLSWAAFNGHESVVRLLVAREYVAADLRDIYGRTPLSRAAFNGHESIVRLLVARDDVTPYSRDDRGQTPLSLAAYKGHENVVRLLIARDHVAAYLRDKKGRTPLAWAAYKGHQSVVRLLVARHDVVADSRDEHGRTPLSRAAYKGHEGVVRLLVARNDVAADSRDDKGRTPLAWAAYKGHQSVVQLLLARDDVAADSKDMDGRTPMLLAAYNGHGSVVRLLVARDVVPVESRGRKGGTLLPSAAYKDEESAMRLLVAQDEGAADTRDVRGGLPLLLTTHNGHESLVRLLLAMTLWKRRGTRRV